MYIADINGKVQHIQDDLKMKYGITMCGRTLLNPVELGIYLDERILPLCKKCANPKDKYLRQWQYLNLYPYEERWALEDEFKEMNKMQKVRVIKNER